MYRSLIKNKGFVLYTQDDLKRLTQLQLDEKIYHTLSTAESFYQAVGGRCFISFSGGIDSTVLEDIINNRYKEFGGKLWDKIPSVFCDTGLENPENKIFIKNKKDVEIIRPKINFLETIKRYGYPLIRKEVAKAIYQSRSKPGGQQDIRMHGEYINPRTGDREYNYSKWLPVKDLPIIISDKCCNVMKKNPFHTYIKETKTFPIVGTTTQESAVRRQAWLRDGCNTFASGKEKCRPVSIWTNQDMLQYIDKYSIKYSKAYGNLCRLDDGKFCMSGCDRTGCMFCAFGMHQEKGETRYQRLKKLYPKIYEFQVGGGEWNKIDGKNIWMPNNNGLGFGKVFDMMNDIYGKDFYRYE